MTKVTLMNKDLSGKTDEELRMIVYEAKHFIEYVSDGVYDMRIVLGDAHFEQLVSTTRRRGDEANYLLASRKLAS